MDYGISNKIMKFSTPGFIKVAAVVTAAPRWVVALLAAEGFVLPGSWLGVWVWISALSNLGMAIVEGIAFAYIFNAYRNQQDKGAGKLLGMAIFAALCFVAIMAPSVSASVRASDSPLNEILTADWSLHVWSLFVSLATIAIVAGVGYAEKQDTARNRSQDSETSQLRNEVKRVASELKAEQAAHGVALKSLQAAESALQAKDEDLTVALNVTETLERQLNENQSELELCKSQIEAMSEAMQRLAEKSVFACDCGETFATQAALNAHKRVHKNIIHVNGNGVEVKE